MLLGHFSKQYVVLFVSLQTAAFVLVAVVQYYRTKTILGYYNLQSFRLTELEGRCTQRLTEELISGNDGNLIHDLERELYIYAHGRKNGRQQRQASMLEAMVSEIFDAQIKILQQHCINNTRLCVHGQRGDRGSRGAKGETGVKGEAGNIGTKGITGASGPKGIPGQVGLKGFQGSKGDDGVRGPPGNKGIKGEPGDIGPVGEKGDEGPPGAKGESGVKGQKGQRGIKGYKGQIGTKGETGPQGPKGLPGEKGDTGPPGTDGQTISTECLCKVPIAPSTTSPVTSPATLTSDVRSVNVGKGLQLTCPLQGTNIRWTKVGSTQITNRAIQTGTTLSIQEVYPGDAGAYVCAAQQNGQTVKKTIQLNVDGSSIYDCDFEKDLCRWTQSTTDGMDWTIDRGGTPTGSTGPDADHTIGGPDGGYAYIEASNFSPQSKGGLTSPSFIPNQRYCFTIWYNMYGADIGDLTVSLQNGQNLTKLWRKKGNQGQGWHRGVLDLPPSSQSFNVYIEASEGVGVRGDTAIDDVIVYTGSCTSNGLVTA